MLDFASIQKEIQIGTPGGCRSLPYLPQISTFCTREFAFFSSFTEIDAHHGLIQRFGMAVILLIADVIAIMHNLQFSGSFLL